MKKMMSKSSALFPDGSSDSEADDKTTTASGSGSSSGFNFKTNNNYAQRYDTWRNKEEIMKVKARYGVDNIDDIGNTSESSSSSEEEWTPAKEKAFFKTLSSLKSKDPKIYDPDTKFFTQEEKDKAERESQSQVFPVALDQIKQEVDSSPKKSKKSKSKEKPFLLKDHERTMILETGGLMSSDEDDEIETEGRKRSSSKKPKNPEKMPIASLSYYQELDSIKKGFSNALKEIESDDDDSESEKLLKKRKPKSEEEERQEEEDYRLWLKGEVGRLEKGKISKGEEKELGFLRSYWNDDKLDEGEKFLRDYILNRKYIEPEEEDTAYIPSYNEIVHDSDEGGLSNDEQFENQREEFEHKYNFRFEEPDPDFIKRFPRTIADSLRRENERRKKSRETARERRKETKDRKLEEVQRLKAMKRKEILDKLQQLQEISGDPDLPLEDMDIEGDFDPEEYDRRMRKVFSDKYYDEDAADDKKPEFPFDPEIDDEVNWDEWVPTEDDEDEPVDMDEDSSKKKNKKYKKNGNDVSEEDPKVEESSIAERSRQKAARRKQKSIEDLIESSKGRKSNKQKSAFLEVIEKKKPKFNPKVHKSFDKYFKEYYALDFEDLIGDLPCRFKYRKVTPNDFGLSTKEILKGEDRELNQWASLKKTYQYRGDDEEKYEAQAYQKKAENEKLKQRALPSIYSTKKENEASDDDEDSDANSFPNQNNKFLNNKTPTVSKVLKLPKTEDETPKAENGKKESKRKRKNRKKKNKNNGIQNKSSDGVESPAKSSEELNGTMKKKIKNKTTLAIPATNDTQASPEVVETSEKQDKKKKKNKKSGNIGNEAEKTTTTTAISDTVSEEKEKNKIQKKKSFKRKAEVSVGVDDERLKAYGLNPKKHKKWVKYGGGAQS